MLSSAQQEAAPPALPSCLIAQMTTAMHPLAPTHAAQALPVRWACCAGRGGAQALGRRLECLAPRQT